MAKRKRSSYGTQALVVVAAVALVVGFVLGRGTSPSKGRGGPEAVEVADAAPGGAGGYVEKKIELMASPTKGPDDAPIKIYEVSDFQ